MRITGKSIRTTKKIKALISSTRSIRFVFDVSTADKEKWCAVGFDEEVKVGDYLLPEVIGNITSFNVNGKELIRKDLPKKPQPRSFHTSWEDWHGNSHSGVQTRYIDMYPREYIQAPTEYLSVIEVEGKNYISTDEFIISDKDDNEIIHLANLMLECFGEFKIVDTLLGKIIGKRIRNLQWEILPPGKYPWSKSKIIIRNATKRLKASDQEVINYRMKVLSVYEPDFLATGRAGFNGYIVYGFESRSIFILESMFLDNATYIFENNWEVFSQLTKNNIINGDIPHRRIIHDKQWKFRIGKLMN